MYIKAETALIRAYFGKLSSFSPLYHTARTSIRSLTFAMLGKTLPKDSTGNASPRGGAAGVAQRKRGLTVNKVSVEMHHSDGTW